MESNPKNRSVFLPNQFGQRKFIENEYRLILGLKYFRYLRHLVPEAGGEAPSTANGNPVRRGLPVLGLGWAPIPCGTPAAGRQSYLRWKWRLESLEDLEG